MSKDKSGNLGRPNPPRCTAPRRINALSVAEMMVAMQDNALTMHELVDLTGLAIKTVRSYVLTLHKIGGCHIAHWEQDKRGAWSTPAWRIGAKKDAQKPARIPDKVRSAAYRTRRAQQKMLAAMAGPIREAA